MLLKPRTRLEGLLGLTGNGVLKANGRMPWTCTWAKAHVRIGTFGAIQAQSDVSRFWYLLDSSIEKGH